MAKTAVRIHFQAKLMRPAEGGEWMFLRVPQDASDLLPTRSILSVEGSMNGFAFQGYLRPDGEGGHWLKVGHELSQGAGVMAGDCPTVEVMPMTVEPEPEVPDDLQAALASSPAAMETWESTTAIARRDWIQWMISGKRPETRGIRLAKAMDMLAKGKRRVCCYDRSGMVSKEFNCPAAAEP